MISRKEFFNSSYVKSDIRKVIEAKLKADKRHAYSHAELIAFAGTKFKRLNKKVIKQRVENALRQLVKEKKAIHKQPYYLHK